MPPIFTREDLKAISKTLYEEKREELKTRQIFRVNTTYPAYASEIGYDIYSRNGSAKIMAAGGSAKDIPFVGEEKTRHSLEVYEIGTGLRYTKAEREAVQAQRALGKGPSVSLDMFRVETARRFIYEEEKRVAFLGDSNYAIKGVFDSSYYGTGLGTKENVADNGTGSSRLWKDKTPQNVLKDIQKGKAKARSNGLFSPDTLVISSDAYGELEAPYSEHSPMTVLDWITSKAGLKKVVETNVISKDHNGDSTDWFMVLDSRPEICELVVTQDIVLGDPVKDIKETSEQYVYLRTAGVIVRHPAAFYIGKGIA